MPLTALTAAFGLFYNLELPASWQRSPKEPKPLLIYGASSAIGAFAIKLAVASEIHPIVAVGSPNSDFIRDTLIAKDGDAFIDYTKFQTPESLVSAIKQAFIDSGVQDGRPAFGFDTISMHGTYDKIMSPAMAGDKIADHKP